MMDENRLLTILRIASDVSSRGEGISLREAISRTDYKPLRQKFNTADLIPVIEANPQLAAEWVAYSQDKRTSFGFWIDHDSLKVGTLASGQTVVQYPSLEEAIAQFIVQELDFWSEA